MRRAVISRGVLVAALTLGAAPQGSTPDTTPGHAEDNVLRIGVLLPQAADPADATSFGSSIGLAGIAAADSAVNLINANGGYDGHDVELFKAAEGFTTDAARDGVTALLDNNVDAIVGPASSVVTVDVLGELMGAGVLTCSPTATSLLLDDFPNRNLFFRVAPSDSTAAQAIADRVRQSGVNDTALVYVDDAFGRPFAEAAAAGLQARGVEISVEVPFDPDDADLSEEASLIAGSGASSIALIADSEHGWAMLTALAGVVDEFSDIPVSIVVNDALSRPPSPDVVMALPAELRDAIQGVSPRGTGLPPEDDEPIGPFATNTFDCVNLIALAAVKAESDDPAAMAQQFVELSRAGAECLSFADCAERIARGLDIDYNGPSGFLTLGDTGDPSRGSFRQFVFNESGVSIDNGPMFITA